MVESGYKLSAEEESLCQIHLGKNVHLDSGYKGQVHLTH